MVNNGTSVLDIQGDLGPGRQTGRNPESREGQSDKGKTGAARVPAHNPVVQMETSPRGGNVH